jgi:hypothetical protein
LKSPTFFENGVDQELGGLIELRWRFRFIVDRPGRFAIMRSRAIRPASDAASGDENTSVLVPAQWGSSLLVIASRLTSRLHDNPKLRRLISHAANMHRMP